MPYEWEHFQSEAVRPSENIQFSERFRAFFKSFRIVFGAFVTVFALFFKSFRRRRRRVVVFAVIIDQLIYKISKKQFQIIFWEKIEKIFF